MIKRQIIGILPGKIRPYVQEKGKTENLQEIRLRVGKPLILVYRGKEQVEDYAVTEHDIRELLDYISDYSLYAFEQEMKQGFITIEGGHRVGITGQAILENGKIKNIRYISSVNLRLAHEVWGCADQVLPFLLKEREFLHTLLISPPRCGKTTLLRDLIRQLSDGNRHLPGITVGVVDERSEIGGCFHGIPQNHLGKRTDILDGCPKAEGMMMLIRSMSPTVIAVDEIGTAEDIHAVEYAMRCGCKILATVHAADLEEVRKKPWFLGMDSQSGFQRYILLGNKIRTGQIDGVYDSKGRLLYREPGTEVCGEKLLC